MGSGAGSAQKAAFTDSQRVPVYRRSLGLPWVIAVVAIPLFIAVIGYAALDRGPATNGPTGAVPTLAPSDASGTPKISLAQLSIARNGDDLTLSGDFPDDSAKAALMDALNGSLVPGVNVIDQIHINPDVDALDFSNAAPVFKDSASITDFSLTVNGDTITLAGTAGSQDQKDAIEGDAKRIWSNLNVVDNLVVNTSAPSTPAAAATCADLQSAINVATGGPITFGNDGFSLTPVDQQALTRVADKLKACPKARASINGYTDNSGADSANMTSSSRRAQKVADFLVAQGVAGNRLAVKGLGSVDPVAPNGTAEGQIQNRRVEIVVR